MLEVFHYILYLFQNIDGENAPRPKSSPNVVSRPADVNCQAASASQAVRVVGPVPPPQAAVVPVRVTTPPPLQQLQLLADCRTELMISPDRLNFNKIKNDISGQDGDSRRAAKLLLMQALRWVTF